MFCSGKDAHAHVGDLFGCLAYRTILMRLAPLAGRLSRSGEPGGMCTRRASQRVAALMAGSGCGPAGALALARVSVLAARLEGRAC
jgi:hypothetical protein